MVTQQLAHAFSNCVREIRKKHVGKGPEKIATRFTGNWAICEMKGNLSSVEKFAIRSEDGRRLVRELRTIFIKELYKDKALQSEVEEIVNAKFVTLFCDYDVELDIAMTVYVFDRPIGEDGRAY